jgi:hypothetical protein
MSVSHYDLWYDTYHGVSEVLVHIHRGHLRVGKPLRFADGQGCLASGFRAITPIASGIGQRP